ncbi:FeoC-like transcriptional regulator [Pseudomonas citronellolis]|uniref:FeoC-like transcriptional regulator n=1 Tax=Pseudomonas citronellolis TaxID=53408 RepID=UPI0023E3AAA5|nr:FeoC-like transcriptional regulator [Pseudomonas citronellolis]MDF3936165.1 FeoC-like transcriptional regulator [Pseudomonas citronellolis]
MASAIALRNLLGELGAADAATLAQRLGAPKALLDALLERLLALGVVEQVAPRPTTCGACKGCAQARGCSPDYRLASTVPLRWQ